MPSSILRTACLALSLIAATPFSSLASAQSDQQQPEQPTLRINSTLVVLDVTVVDKNGKPVTTGLNKEDFTITEQGKPQRLFSFEAPEDHAMAPGSSEDDLDGKSPATIFVLDRLNSFTEEAEQYRQALRAYFTSQPATLSSPAEIMVLGNDSFDMLQGFTRSRDDLLFAVNHLQPVNPYKLGSSPTNIRADFDSERSRQSIDALFQVALQNVGVSGRKNIFWLGPGGPNLSRAASATGLEKWRPYVQTAIDLLVDTRISLFVIYPQLRTDNFTIAWGDAGADDRSPNKASNPASGDLNFPVFARETGGAILYNRNDTLNEIIESRDLGAHYYTLSYQPADKTTDGKYRHIHIDVRGPGGLRAVTKDGYFAIDRNSTFANPQEKTVSNITTAAMSSMTFSALSVRVSDVTRDPETHVTGLTVHIKPHNLNWTATADGKKSANLVLAILTFNSKHKVLSWKFNKIAMQSTAPDPDKLQDEMRAHLSAALPPKTATVRIMLETADGGRMGSADITRQELESAPPPKPVAPAQPTPGQTH